jgi:dUTPase
LTGSIKNISFLEEINSEDENEVDDESHIPICKLYNLHSNNIAKSIKDFCSVPSNIISHNNGVTIIWKGINVIDFLSKLYGETKLYNNTKLYNDTMSFRDNRIETFNKLKNWRPKRNPVFQYVLNCDDIYKPQKSRESDAGYDLHLVKKIKEENGVSYYDTCVKIKPEYGYYCELVGRSSIAKTGYMMANNIGIIDANYNGSIIVALIKINPNAEELKLPIKLVQILPRKHISIDLKKVSELDSTLRNDDGGLGSKNIK